MAVALNIADLAEHAIDAVPDRVAVICAAEAAHENAKAFHDKCENWVGGRSSLSVKHPSINQTKR
ncbi:hypothetical protein ABLN79_18580, partial [Mycobacterium tuberculosis]